MIRPTLMTVLLTACSAPPAVADDWPQWLGPLRDSVWRETGVVERIPEQGLPVIWRAEAGLGYAGPAVSDGRVFVMDYLRKSGEINNIPGGRDELKGAERVLCLDAATGKLLWEHKYDRTYNIAYPGGPRCTPAVDSGRVYALGAEGDLWCLEADSGRVVWSKSLTKEYDTETPIWGFAAHPLVDGEMLYCIVGGEGSVAVAFDKQTGREVWRALSARTPGYCPPTMIEHAGTKQLLIWHPGALNSLDPRTGEVYWSVPLKPDFGMSIAAPRKHGPHLFASGVRSAAVLLKLDDEKPAAEVLWRGKAKTALYSASVTPIIDDGTIYGCDGNTGRLMAVRMTDGERLWETMQPTTGGERRAGYGTAFLVKHRDRYFLFSETGDLILAKLSPDGYNELGRFHVLEPTNSTSRRKVVWSHPAFARRCLFARNDKQIVCVDLAAGR